VLSIEGKKVCSSQCERAKNMKYCQSVLLKQVEQARKGEDEEVPRRESMMMVILWWRVIDNDDDVSVLKR